MTLEERISDIERRLALLEEDNRVRKKREQKFLKELQDFDAEVKARDKAREGGSYDNKS